MTGHALLRSEFFWNISASEKFICNVTMPMNGQNITFQKLSRQTALSFVNSHFSSVLRTVGGVGGLWEGFKGLVGMVLV